MLQLDDFHSHTYTIYTIFFYKLHMCYIHTYELCMSYLFAIVKLHTYSNSGANKTSAAIATCYNSGVVKGQSKIFFLLQKRTKLVYTYISENVRKICPNH
jgi:hypothetical protein